MTKHALVVIHDSMAVGGAELCLLRILRQARDWGFPTYLITHQPDTLYSAFCDVTQQQLLVDFPYPRKPISWRYIYTFYQKANRFLNRISTPIMLLSGDYYTLWASLLLRKKGRAVYSYWQGELKPHSDQKWIRYGANRADLLIASEPALAHMCRHDRLKKPTQCLNPFIDPSFLIDPVSDQQELEQLKHQLGVGKHQKVAICHGRISPMKGQYELARSFLACAPLKDWVLLLVGPIDEDHRLDLVDLQNVSQGRLKWLGHQSNIKPLLALADLTLYPSLLHESFGCSIAEAACMRKPILAIGLGAVPYLLPGHKGLVKVGDPAALIDLWATGPIEHFIPAESSIQHIRSMVDPNHSILKSILERPIGSTH